jgi:phosphohistidine phosphatase
MPQDALNTMLILSLLRHAKSSWDDPRLDDHERPLAKRGAKEAPRIGAYMSEHELKPDLVICSSAVRTRATLALVLAEWSGPPPRVVFEDDLYLGPPVTLLMHLQEVKAPARHVLLVGHNPGVHALALECIGSGDRKLIAGLAKGFPTAALAVITFEAGSWADIRAASGRLRHFAVPRLIG